MAKLTGEKRRNFRNALELRLRRATGNAFQDLTASILSRVYGDNFVPQCPWGAKGDLSCDGFLRSPQTIFACYGPANGTMPSGPAKLVSKAKSDYVGAVSHWPDMEEWVFVSNFAGVFPAPVTSMLETLSKGSTVKVGYLGWDRFEHLLLEMDEEVIADLVGEIQVKDDYIRLQPEVIHKVVSSIAAEFTLSYLDEVPTKVPINKLQINDIPPCQAIAIKNGLLGREAILACVVENADTTLATRLSVAFTLRYKELRLQHFAPDEIMDRLYDFALGGQQINTAAYNTAAWAVLAYLFESCSIFEDKPRITAT